MMFDLSILGVLSWAELANVKRLVVEQSLSNILIALYAVAYVTNRRATFLVAFLVMELYGNS